VTIDLSLKGTVYPATAFGAKRRLTVTAQREWEGHWRSKASARPTVRGTYAIVLKTPGTYRIVYDGLDGPNVKVP
jgi:hypothetical protein